ncbi:hypothetical protein MMC30_005030 [Trapelia coarctata]|nr:hypothetical protein [Trapelia coarctata]
MEGAAGYQKEQSLKYLASNTNSTFTSISPALVNRVLSLPQELFNQVIDRAIRAHVQPGRIYFGRSMDPRIPSALGDASKSATFRRYAATILLAQNIWPAFLRSLPPSALATITAMELPLCYDDARDYHPGDKYTYCVRKARECRYDQEPVDYATIGHDYDNEVWQWENQLARTWIEKVKEVAGMKLGYLRLEFTAADVNDVGRSLARFMRSLSKLEFKHGLPPHFEVVAGTKQAAGCVERKMRELFTTEWTTEGTCACCQGGLH